MAMTMRNPAPAEENLRPCTGAMLPDKAFGSLCAAQSTPWRLLKGPAAEERNRLMRQAACICSALLLASLSACSMQDARNAVNKLSAKVEQATESPQPEQPAQPAEPAKKAKTARPARHAKEADPLLEATPQDLAEYLRGKMLTLSPSDGINDNLAVSFDPSTSILTVLQPGSRCVHYLNALDTNNMSWEIFDPSDSHNSREALLRLTITSSSGKTARRCFDEKGHPDVGTSTNRVRLLFSLSGAEQTPGFQNKMTKVVKRLITLAGGAPEKDIFQDSSSHSAGANK